MRGGRGGRAGAVLPKLCPRGLSRRRYFLVILGHEITQLLFKFDWY
jgi:hypothetical protein